MAVKTSDDPVVQARQLIAEARHQFAQDVDALLASTTMELRAVILERFEEYLPMRRLADPVLLQLLREAYELLNDPESRLNHRDWNKAAAPLLKG